MFTDRKRAVGAAVIVLLLACALLFYNKQKGSTTNSKQVDPDTTAEFLCLEMLDDTASIMLVKNTVDHGKRTSWGAYKGRTHALKSADGPFAHIKGAGGKHWESELIRVHFMDGHPDLIAKVKKAAKGWEDLINVKFAFTGPGAGTGDIRISFTQRKLSSRIGTDSRGIGPSMMLGALSLSHPDSFVDRKVMHEFGHALGMIHEHMNPKAGTLPWNETAVIAYFMKNERWSEQEVRANILDKYDQPWVNADVFDPLSIMVYTIPPGLLKGDFLNKTNQTPSQGDVDFLRKHYGAPNR